MSLAAVGVPGSGPATAEEGTVYPCGRVSRSTKPPAAKEKLASDRMRLPCEKSESALEMIGCRESSRERVE